MNELDWDAEPELGAWGAAGSAALLITAGLYWTAVWVVSGLAPLPVLASRAMRRREQRQSGTLPRQMRSAHIT
jgi:hypothetical protein